MMLKHRTEDPIPEALFTPLDRSFEMGNEVVANPHPFRLMLVFGPKISAIGKPEYQFPNVPSLSVFPT